MDSDPDSGGPKTYGRYGSGSATLSISGCSFTLEYGTENLPWGMEVQHGGSRKNKKKFTKKQVTKKANVQMRSKRSI
jgi:hypothetical protein